LGISQDAQDGQQERQPEDPKAAARRHDQCLLWSMKHTRFVASAAAEKFAEMWATLQFDGDSRVISPFSVLDIE
jgi:hypothetical protein